MKTRRLIYLFLGAVLIVFTSVNFKEKGFIMHLTKKWS